MRKPTRHKSAFTLIELLVVIAIIGLLLSILMPALSRARQQAQSIQCMSNLRQLSLAFQGYANAYRGYAVPCYDGKTNTYWWGNVSLEGIDHEAGFLWPYLNAPLGEKSVFECPAQPFGTYSLQAKPPNEPPAPRWITSTYGYNGYYLSSPASAWQHISHHPWQQIGNVTRPCEVIAFADTLIDWDIGDGIQLENNALLDPPYLLSLDRRTWEKNPCPTTCFRHSDRANAVFVDGHCGSLASEEGYVSPRARIGSAGEDTAPRGSQNAPHYVPDYSSWTVSRRRGGPKPGF
jgi:prepilin-type N-terminal cleavage/methylation domain-containing protein/prepilin-type processing-associated H-X9-DG protein